MKLLSILIPCLVCFEASAQSQIAFSAQQGSDRGWSIYTVDPDGSNRKVLIPFKTGLGEYNPEISPDGKTILFNTYRYGGWKLAAIDRENSTPRRLTKSSAYYTNGAFSPDGQRIAYEKAERGEGTYIFIADADGRNEQTLTRKLGNENRMPSWSKDGKAIYLYSDRGGACDIYRVDIATGDILHLTAGRSGNNFNPSVSPDGTQVAFFSDRDGYLDLFVMDVTGANQVNLTENLHSEFNTYNYYTDDNMFWIFKASWSPDGQSLVFSNSTEANVDLFTIRKDGRDLTQITKTPGSEFTPVWGRSGG